MDNPIEDAQANMVGLAGGLAFVALLSVLAASAATAQYTVRRCVGEWAMR